VGEFQDGDSARRLANNARMLGATIFEITIGAHQGPHDRATYVAENAPLAWPYIREACPQKHTPGMMIDSSTKPRDQVWLRVGYRRSELPARWRQQVRCAGGVERDHRAASDKDRSERRWS
jgi:hypothetical protein